MQKYCVLILDAEEKHPPSIYDPAGHWSFHLRRHKIPFEIVKVTRPLPSTWSSKWTHLIITGSSASAAKEAKPLHWFSSAEKLIGEAIDKNIPVLGICFGHQFLGRMYGTENVRVAKEPEIGWLEIKIVKSDPLLGEAGSSVYVFNIHSDEVYRLPKEATLLASSAMCPIHAFRIEEKPVWGIQSHPEMTIPIAKNFLQNQIQIATGPKLAAIHKALQSETKDDGWVEGIVKNFISVPS